ncbi:MAG: hypothetical protein NC079_02705 [Clostridium sp.]|nr:hypothetical protein [Acetatifactor muris]MCM1527175.1 hypothetical protein [Bacteroides sp.]MCM1562500.1 hypothetical protein [Clostridium sp.]
MMIETKVRQVVLDNRLPVLEYARPGGGAGRMESPNWGREREKLKESLLPFVRESVRKLLREERAYYRSRPSMAAKYMEQVFGVDHMESALVPGIALRVYERVEERMRLESVRKGR